MRPDRTLPPAFSLAVLAAFPLALLSGCAEWKMEPGYEEALPGEDGEPGLAADGQPPPWTARAPLRGLATNPESPTAASIG